MNHAQRMGHLIRTSSKKEKRRHKNVKRQKEKTRRNGEKQTRTRGKLIGKSGQKIKYKS